MSVGSKISSLSDVSEFAGYGEYAMARGFHDGERDQLVAAFKHRYPGRAFPIDLDGEPGKAFRDAALVWGVRNE